MTRALSAENARKTQLEDCELKIKSAFRRGLEATCVIAKELHKIYSQELYTVVASDFKEYVTDYLKIDRRTYDRIIEVSQTVHQLQKAGLELPANESQVAELARLDVELRPKVWNELVIRAEKEEKTLTVDDVKRAVEIAAEATPRKTRGPAAADDPGVEIALDDNGSEPPAKKKAAPVQEAILVLSEKGEAAINRIRKVCGDEVADALTSGTHAMTERDIRSWAEFDNEMMRQLVFFIFDQQYTLTKAVSFLNREISEDTDVGDLILIAGARGGTAMINYDNRAKIVVELKKTA